MTIIPKVRTKFGENIGTELFITYPNLSDNESTFIAVDSASGASSFTVDNGLKFSVGEFIVIGNLGAEKSELIRIHTSTTPTATTITLNSNTSFSHSRGEQITFIPYDQIFIERSVNSGSSYSTLDTVSLRVDVVENYFQHTSGASTDLYRVSFKNSDSSDFSEVSDGIISTGYGANTAGALIRGALLDLGEKIDDEVLTKEFLFNALDDGRDEIDQHEEVERWSFRTKFDTDIGNIISGQYKTTVPTDLRDGDTYKNILAVRIGRDNLPLRQIDKRTLNDHFRGIAHTTLDGAVADTDTSITLTSSGDFDDSGAIKVAAPSVLGTIDVIDYTANNVSTNVISGVTNIASGGHSDDIDVWQGASFGRPTEYAVFEETITFSQPFEDAIAGENIWLDYYADKIVLNSDADVFDEPFFKIYKSYMKYRIKLRKNPQMNRDNDVDYKSWIEKREAQVSKEFLAQDIRIQIDVPGASFFGNGGFIR